MFMFETHTHILYLKHCGSRHFGCSCDSAVSWLACPGQSLCQAVQTVRAVCKRLCKASCAIQAVLQAAVRNAGPVRKLWRTCLRVHGEHSTCRIGTIYTGTVSLPVNTRITHIGNSCATLPKLFKDFIKF